MPALADHAVPEPAWPATQWVSATAEQFLRAIWGLVGTGGWGDQGEAEAVRTRDPPQRSGLGPLENGRCRDQRQDCPQVREVWGSSQTRGWGTGTGRSQDGRAQRHPEGRTRVERHQHGIACGGMGWGGVRWG